MIRAATVGAEEDERLLSKDPFVDHLTRLGIPEPDAVGVPAAACRPPAVSAEGPDLPLGMAVQLPPHRPGFRIQDLVGTPDFRDRHQRAARPGRGQNQAR